MGRVLGRVWGAKGVFRDGTIEIISNKGDLW
jgi:hypothetical protein